MRSAGFIGGGRVTRILVGGWARAGALPPRVVVHDISTEALEALERAVPAVQRVSAQEAAAADVVFLALHPPALTAALQQIAPQLRPESVVVSLAPKIPLGALEAIAGTKRVARMIPNAPSLVGRGYNPVTYGTVLDESAKRPLEELFAPWGAAPEVPEAHLEAYAILTGMGPTYFWFQWQALREVCTAFGLPAVDCDEALRATMKGAMATLLDAGLPPAAVMDLVPVKPLVDMQPSVTEAYQKALPALYAKIQPAQPVLAG